MLKKFLIIILILSLLISACDFRPSHKVIAYQEEVKLSDGSMIWVDIKRHYSWSGWAPGGGSGAYLPGVVEISWDTGFPSVGKKTMISDADSSAIYTLDKRNGMWYVAMNVNRSLDFYKNNVGNEISYGIMVYVINDSGQFVKINNMPKLYRNITSDHVNDLNFLNKNPAKFTWQEKLNQFNNKGLAVGNELYPNANISK